MPLRMNNQQTKKKTKQKNKFLYFQYVKNPNLMNYFMEFGFFEFISPSLTVSSFYPHRPQLLLLAHVGAILLLHSHHSQNLL